MKRLKLFFLTVVLSNAGFSIFSQTAEEWKLLGNTESENGNYRNAIEYYQKAIDIDSTYFDAHFNMGLAYVSLLEIDSAVFWFYNALYLKDTIPDTYFALGAVFAEEKNDIDKAIELFNQGLILKPDSPEEYYYLGFLYREKENYEEAVLCAKKAAQLGDSSAQRFLNDIHIRWDDGFSVPDYEYIKMNIENEQSNLFYSNLWKRYQQGDNTMTFIEKQHLYYGYVFHENYSPYKSTHDYKQVNAIFDKEFPTRKEWENVASLLNTSLEGEPFNIRYLYDQLIAFDKLGNTMEYERNINKIRIILDALSTTGDGLSKETAIHVIYVSSEYDFLFVNKLTPKSQALTEGGFDVLYLKPNDENLNELWFDVNRPLSQLRKSYDNSFNVKIPKKEKKKRN